MAAANSNADEIQAVFIYNFTKFISWPQPESVSTDTAVADPSPAFIIAVAGSCAVENYLKTIAEKKNVDGRPIAIVRYAYPDSLPFCHILFIPPGTGPDRLRSILTRTADKPVLTVSATEGFAARGSGINFVVRDNRVRFEINNGSLVEAGLKASSQLLKLGILVDDLEQEGAE